MADNVTLPGTGEVIATDDIGGVQYQQMKLVDGTLGSANAAVVDGDGRLTVRSHPRRAKVVKTTFYTTNSTENILLSGRGAGLFADLTHLSLFNSSATSVTVTLRSAAGGAADAVFIVPAGGGAVLTFPVPMPQTTANSAWTLQSSAGVSTLLANAVFIVEA